MDKKTVDLVKDHEGTYAAAYNESSFWETIRRYARTIGEAALYNALTLYYVLQKPNLPPWCKTVVYGALGYLILPLDALPDLLPGIGLTVDIGVLSAALPSLSVRHDSYSHAYPAAP